MEHHKTLPPSSALAILQWACYQPDPAVGKAAQRGTLLHDCLGAALEGKSIPHELSGDDMYEVLWAMNYILDRTRNAKQLRVEALVNINGMNGNQISFGHADAHELMEN